MEDTVYIKGTARDAATRALRRAALPRTMLVRIGPWTIRPAKRTPVRVAALASFEADVIVKVTQGLVQVQRGDTTPFSITELRELFASLRSPDSAPTFMSMPFAALMEVMRSDTPSQEAWDAFIDRCLVERESDREMLPDMGTRLRALRDLAERNSARLDVTSAFSRITAAETALEAAQAAAEAKRASEPDPNTIETQPAPPEPTMDTLPEAVAEALPDMEQADLDAEPEAEPEVVEATAVPGTDRAEREARLPEGWRTFTNAKLVELLSSLEVELPERQNKASLVAAVEAWLEGS